MGNFKIQPNSSEMEYFKSVVILNAGGTINMSGDNERKPSKGVQKIVEMVKTDLESKFNINISFQEIFERPPDSSNIGEKEWNIIIKNIIEVYEKKREIEKKLCSVGIKIEKGGIVITHGTDTIALTSFIVSLVLSQLPDFLTIIFTGSHSVIDAPNSDAINNLKKSIFASKERFQEEDNNLPPGVYVLFGQEIHLCSRLTKTRTFPDSDGKYFFSFPASIALITSTHISKLNRDEMGINGSSYRIKIHFDSLEYLIQFKNKKDILTSKEKKTEFEWGIVEYLIIDKHTSIEVLTDFKRRVNYYRSRSDLDKRKIGLIIQGNFKNNSNFNLFAELIKEIGEMKVAIFVGSKEVYSILYDEYNILNLGLIHKSMSHMKALIKLKYLLRFDIEFENIKKYMNTNIVGEVFDTDEFPEWINYETFPLGHEIVVIYPNIHPRVIEDSFKRLKNENDKKKKLILYGYGDGHLPTNNKSISDIVIEFFIKEGLISNSTIESNSDESYDVLIFKFCKHFESNNREQLREYINLNYNISGKELSDELDRLISEEIFNKKLNEIEGKFINFIDGCKQKNKEQFTIKNSKTLIKMFLNEIEIDVNKKYKTELKRSIFKSDIELKNIELLNLLLKKEFIPLIMRRLFKDALASVDPLLNIISEIVDSGFSVEVKTSAVKSKTDTSRYEAGCKLMMIGVNSDELKGWNTLYLRKK